ncbi:Uncharacterized protein pbN1_03980 [Aromatoleum bremense]|nr:Uncharacterized protein pbN1_03980 [Aromatoleum bremense]
MKRAVRVQENAGPPQVFLSPSGGGNGKAVSWGRSKNRTEDGSWAASAATPDLSVTGATRGRRDGLAAADLQVAVREARVAQSVAERVHRLSVLLCVPAVPDFRAFVVANRGRCAPRRAQAGQLRSRGLGEVRRKGDRQTARRVPSTQL